MESNTTRRICGDKSRIVRTWLRFIFGQDQMVSAKTRRTYIKMFLEKIVKSLNERDLFDKIVNLASENAGEHFNGIERPF
jgi:hypothetical protein